tara:strand:+ start:45 stop:320 length:276 start_codon:yes stop_codon:yes gene_type:complete
VKGIFSISIIKTLLKSIDESINGRVVDGFRQDEEIFLRVNHPRFLNNALTCGFERVRRIELPSSAWKAEVLAVELHPQSVSMVAVRVSSEV